MMTTKEYPCPFCEDEIEIDGNEQTVTCKSCGMPSLVNYDAEQVDGRWHDLTTLSKHEALYVHIFYPTYWNVFEKFKWSGQRYVSTSYPIVVVHH